MAKPLFRWYPPWITSVRWTEIWARILAVWERLRRIPYYTPEIARECMETIFLPTIHAMQKEGRPFQGCLYFGLMLTPKGPKVIEYNCRFGDPETQVVLPLLKTDLVEIMQAIWEEKLDQLEIQWKDEQRCMRCYGKRRLSRRSTSLVCQSPVWMKTDRSEGCFVYHAGTKLGDGKILTSGGRVLGVTATADSLRNALKTAYAGVEKITFQNAHYRKDIGQRALKALPEL